MRISPFIFALLLSATGSHSAELDTVSTSASMDVALYASITGLDAFTLTTTDKSGSANAVYSGSDTYHLESNGQVTVLLTSSSLSLSGESINTTFTLDGKPITSYTTESNSVHNATHTVEGSAQLGKISDQKAGEYFASVTLTVIGID
ncbi:hypothetical protein GCM10023116_26070 [Kistimonas scapharcae]|uniref:Fimbrial protein n=1 Tax=Kistimonas scapharcae TaxID=1036133 RepID=A0ABP8V4J6_9GAMM